MKMLLKLGFWDFVINGNDKYVRSSLNPFDGAMKFNLNMKWGR